MWVDGLTNTVIVVLKGVFKSNAINASTHASLLKGFELVRVRGDFEMAYRGKVVAVIAVKKRHQREYFPEALRAATNRASLVHRFLWDYAFSRMWIASCTTVPALPSEVFMEWVPFSKMKRAFICSRM